MQTRTTECYRAAIGALKHLIPGLRPKSIMCDYEAAQQKAFALEFPNAERHGCLFHASKVYFGFHENLNHLFKQFHVLVISHLRC